MTQEDLFIQVLPARADRYALTHTSDIIAALASDCVVAFSVSGGKDSVASAWATSQHLDRIGHSGPRVLIHSDLGRSEWVDSLPQCEALAKLLGLELIVVRRRQGDMLDRWQQRHRDNVKRYVHLSCVTLITPWATAGMRFCTSEMKVSPIVQALSTRFPGRTIVSVAGLRRAESPQRAKAPTSSPWKSSPRKVVGLNWHPIDMWSTADVFACIADHALPLHPAYTRYRSTRVSCTACILQSDGDSKAAASCVDNIPYLRELIAIEISSAFSFKQSGWLADSIPEILTADELAAVACAKLKADERRHLEKSIPKRMLYEKGWPTSIPSLEDAEHLAEVRRRVGELMGYPMKCTTGVEVVDRYLYLMAEKERKAA